VAILRRAPIKTALSFEEFLDHERQSPLRHEFVDGNLFVMAGGTDRHNLIALQLAAFLLPAALGHGFHAYINDVLLAAPNGRGYYPDIFVVCDRSLRFALKPMLKPIKMSVFNANKPRSCVKFILYADCARNCACNCSRTRIKICPNSLRPWPVLRLTPQKRSFQVLPSISSASAVANNSICNSVCC
jgi:hypothetical protein